MTQLHRPASADPVVVASSSPAAPGPRPSTAPAGSAGSSGHTPPRREDPAPASWLTRLALIGPAFIAGAWQFGPGNLASAVQAGSGYGYTLIWVIAVSTVLMIFYTDMSVRIGIAGPGTVIQTVKQALGRPVGVAAGIGVFAITLMFSVGNAAGSGLALSMLFGGNPVLWSALCTVAVAFVLLARNVYRVVERLLVAIVMVMGVGFVVTAFVARPEWGAALGGMVPSLPAGSELLVIALVGTNFSINAAFFTGYATRRRGLTPAQYRDSTMTDTIPGIVAPGVMTALVIAVAAAVLGRAGAEAATLPALAAVFEPVAGQLGTTAFALGFFGAAFSSMLANCTAGGTLLSDGLGWGGSFEAGRTKLLVAAVLVFGLAVVAFNPGAQLQLIIVAQALTVLVAPLLAVVLMAVSNHRVLGDFRNRWWQNVAGVVGLVAVLALSTRLVLQLTA